MERNKLMYTDNNEITTLFFLFLFIYFIFILSENYSEFMRRAQKRPNRVFRLMRHLSHNIRSHFTLRQSVQCH